MMNIERKTEKEGKREREKESLRVREKKTASYRIPIEVCQNIQKKEVSHSLQPSTKTVDNGDSITSNGTTFYLIAINRYDANQNDPFTFPC